MNSGLSVFFFTAVLCFDFLFSSGFRYLEEADKELPVDSNGKPGNQKSALNLFYWTPSLIKHKVTHSPRVCPLEGAVVPLCTPHLITTLCSVTLLHHFYCVFRWANIWSRVVVSQLLPASGLMCDMSRVEMQISLRRLPDEITQLITSQSIEAAAP